MNWGPELPKGKRLVSPRWIMMIIIMIIIIQSKMLYWLYDVGQASDMRALVWNNELEAVAQRWADQCTFGHDSVSIAICDILPRLGDDDFHYWWHDIINFNSWLLLLKTSSEPSNVRRDVSWAKCLHEHVLPGCQLTFSKFPSRQGLSNDLQHFLRFLKPLHLKYLSNRCPRQRWVWFLKTSLKRKSTANSVV